mgnify:CR=1 FL=1
MRHTITITLTDEEGDRLARFLRYKRLCGDLDPQGNPLDALGLQVLAAARAQQAHNREEHEDGLSGVPRGL